MAWCRQTKAITWANVNPDICRHMASLGVKTNFERKNEFIWYCWPSEHRGHWPVASLHRWLINRTDSRLAPSQWETALHCKAPFTQGCDLRATFGRPENGKDAQWSPKPRKFCFCVTAAARSLCLPWTTKAADVAQQVAQRRQSGGRTIAKVAQGLPWSPNGGTVVATVISQWSAKGVIQGRQKPRSKWCTMFITVRIFYGATDGRPLCNHSASTAMCVPSSCLLWATSEQPTSSATFVRLFEHAQNFTATMASMATSERPVYHPWTTKATVRPPFCLQRWPGQFCGRTREAQRSQPLCNGGTTTSLIGWAQA